MNPQQGKVQNMSFQTKDGISARLSSLLEAPGENVLSCFFRLLEHPCMSWLVVLHCLQSFSYLIPLILTFLTPFSTIWVSCGYNVPTSDQKNNSYLNVSLLATFASEKTFIPKQTVIFIGYSNQHVDTFRGQIIILPTRSEYLPLCKHTKNAGLFHAQRALPRKPCCIQVRRCQMTNVPESE